ncbi:hypothetical protein H7U37_14570, partial [Pseudoflavonifractor phocaeensis]|nr:hypothetical protein [Pseudoflavonifractor phocaeensis]
MKRNLPALLAFAAAAVALVAAGILIWRSSQGPVLPTPQYTARPDRRDPHLSVPLGKE